MSDFTEDHFERSVTMLSRLAGQQREREICRALKEINGGVMPTIEQVKAETPLPIIVEKPATGERHLYWRGKMVPMFVPLPEKLTTMCRDGFPYIGLPSTP